MTDIAFLGFIGECSSELHLCLHENSLDQNTSSGSLSKDLYCYTVHLLVDETICVSMGCTVILYTYWLTKQSVFQWEDKSRSHLWASELAYHSLSIVRRPCTVEPLSSRLQAARQRENEEGVHLSHVSAILHE